MNYKCVEIPEPDFDASFTDEMVVTAYQDEDDFNPQMLDEYPNIRLTQLEADIQQTSLTAAEAFETANNAEELASQASQAATTATESANAASNLASQAAQAAQQAAGIAEGAATTAGEAAQSINEHAQATTNPHATNVTQEFADTQITPLAVEATYTPTVWSYLVGLFTTVPKSVLQHLVKLWGVVNNLAVRIGLLEDKYILRYVVPVNTNYIDLTIDKNGNAINIAEGETFEIIIPIREWVNPLGTSRINLRFNGITSSIYRVGNTGLLPNMLTQGTHYYNNDVRVKLTLVGGNLHGHTMAYQESPKGTFVAGTPQMYGCRTEGYSFSAINRIELLVANANEIPAGVVILLKKL